MRCRLRVFSVLVLLAALACGSTLVAKGGQLPASLSAAILVRLMSFEDRSLDDHGISIHVLDSVELAAELRTHVGSSIGSGKLGSVTFGSDLPEAPVDVVVATKEAAMSLALRYTAEVGAVSVTTNPKLRTSGASLVIFDDEGMPGILLNRFASDREGLRWQPEILQVAKVVGN